MVKTLLTSFVLLLGIFVKAQNYEYPFYFEDAVGNRDTLILGIHLNATPDLNSNLGEINTITTPLDADFDVRVSDAAWSFGEVNWTTKKKLSKSTCNTMQYQVIAIQIKAKHWPVTLSWDPTPFSEENCIKGSVFTSVHAGGWFDVGSLSDLYVMDLKNDNTVTFSQNAVDGNYVYDWGGYINSTNDTLSYFFFGWMDPAARSMNVDKIQQNTIQTYPNPASDQLTIDYPSEKIESISMTDLLGKKQAVSFNNGTVDLASLSNGHYLLQINTKEGKLIAVKVIKD